MGGKEIETDEQQKNKPDQPKVILKPLLKGIHESPLAHFGLVGLTAEGNLPDLSRRAIHRIPIHWPTGWARFRRGRAFFGPNPWKYPLSIVSECIIQKESAGERGHHMYVLASDYTCMWLRAGCALDLRPDMAILSERATIYELSDFTLPYGGARDQSSECCARTDFLEGDFVRHTIKCRAPH
jgi:hypothetical protein